MASNAAAPVFSIEGPTAVHHRSGRGLSPILLLLIPLVTTSGQTAQRPPSPGRITLYALKAVTSSIIVAVGKPHLILRSTDGGQSWRSVSGPGGTTGDLYGIDFIDTNSGWAVGERGAILSTNHGG